MNTKEAKRINLPNLMAKLGYKPTAIKKGGNEYWYQSPFRQEKDSSFHTSFLGGKWIWNDFADSGGTVIDFVMRHENFTTVGQVLKFLDRMYQTDLFQKSKTQPFSFQQQSPPQEGKETFKNKELEFIKAHQIFNPIIFKYLEGRGIPEYLAFRYLREVKYRNIISQKDFFAFGMKNESGGYEIRAASDKYKFKSALIKRDITLIKGNQKDTYTVNVFEGMIDYLSLLVMLNVSNLSGDSIIMHSLSSFQSSVTAIESMKYKKANLFLDNNKAGREHTEKFQTHFGELVVNQSYLFEPYEDVNDALVANAIPNFYMKSDN